MADLIRIKRGNKANLPTLNDGEFGLTEDTKELFIGTTTGNVKIGVLNAWGDNTQANRSRVFASSNATQAVSAATGTKVLFQTVSKDNLSEFSSSRFTAKAAGTYLITGVLVFNTSLSGVQRNITAYKNGSAFRDLTVDVGSTQSAPQIPYSVTLDLNVGDYVEIYTYTGSASTLGINSSFDITRIA